MTKEKRQDFPPHRWSRWPRKNMPSGCLNLSDKNKISREEVETHEGSADLNS